MLFSHLTRTIVVSNSTCQRKMTELITFSVKASGPMLTIDGVLAHVLMPLFVMQCHTSRQDVALPSNLRQSPDKILPPYHLHLWVKPGLILRNKLKWKSVPFASKLLPTLIMPFGAAILIDHLILCLPGFGCPRNGHANDTIVLTWMNEVRASAFARRHNMWNVTSVWFSWFTWIMTCQNFCTELRWAGNRNNMPAA